MHPTLQDTSIEYVTNFISSGRNIDEIVYVYFNYLKFFYFI